MPYVARLMNSPELLLLAEPGLLDGMNVAFKADGQSERHPYGRFDQNSEVEIELESQEITAAQRHAFARYEAAVDSAERRRKFLEMLKASVSKHPVRHDADRFGGVFLPKARHEWDDVVAKLEAWLRHATDEDVIGSIDGFGRKPWLKTKLPDLNGGMVEIGINADTKAEGVASFLAFVDGCGGPAQVRAQRTGGPPVLLSNDGTVQFGTSSLYSYFYLTDLS